MKFLYTVLLVTLATVLAVRYELLVAPCLYADYKSRCEGMGMEPACISDFVQVYDLLSAKCGKEERIWIAGYDKDGSGPVYGDYYSVAINSTAKTRRLNIDEIDTDQDTTKLRPLCVVKETEGKAIDGGVKAMIKAMEKEPVFGGWRKRTGSSDEKLRLLEKTKLEEDFPKEEENKEKEKPRRKPMRRSTIDSVPRKHTPVKKQPSPQAKVIRINQTTKVSSKTTKTTVAKEQQVEKPEEIEKREDNHHHTRQPRKPLTRELQGHTGTVPRGSRNSAPTGNFPTVKAPEDLKEPSPKSSPKLSRSEDKELKRKSAGRQGPKPKPIDEPVRKANSSNTSSKNSSKSSKNTKRHVKRQSMDDTIVISGPYNVSTTKDQNEDTWVRMITDAQNAEANAKDTDTIDLTHKIGYPSY